jgi:hypothetical protein
LGKEEKVLMYKNWRNMAREFWYGLLSSLFGAAIGVVVIAVLLKFGWENREGVLILGTQGVIALTIIFVKNSNRMKKEDLRDIDFKIEKKADRKDIEKLQCQIDIMHQTIEHVAKSQEEEHATIDKIYDILIRPK